MAELAKERTRADEAEERLKEVEEKLKSKEKEFEEYEKWREGKIDMDAREAKYRDDADKKVNKVGVMGVGLGRGS